MSVNKNLSKLALNVNSDGDVTEAGLSVAYASNSYTTGTFVSNTFFQNNNNPNAVTNGYFQATYTAADVLTKIKTVDGAGSGLDADTLDGSNSSFFTNASNIDSGTLASARLSGTYAINISGSSDTVDGLEATDLSSNNYLQTQLGTKLNSSSYTASDVLTKIKTVDGAGSGLDADTLDGLQATNLASNNYVQGRFSSNGYMQSYVSTEVANLVDSAPSTLDTLNELAAALGDDANFSTTVTTSIGLRATNTYVNSTFTSNNYFQDNLFPVGGGSDQLFYENDQTVTTNYTITTGKNAMSAGPINVSNGVIVTIPSGSEWTIV